jgi:hypothetical protein
LVNYRALFELKILLKFEAEPFFAAGFIGDGLGEAPLGDDSFFEDAFILI